VLPRVPTITSVARITTSARWTSGQGSPAPPRLHMFPTPALFLEIDPVLACGMWRMEGASRHTPPHASDVGAACIECGQDTHASTPVAGRKARVAPVTRALLRQDHPLTSPHMGSPHHDFYYSHYKTDRRRGRDDTVYVLLYTRQCTSLRCSLHQSLLPTH
jgi:hypothetical protein